VSSAHYIYIPMVLMVGLILGFIIGGRMARDAYNMELERERERDAARAERAARKAARQADDADDADDAERDQA